MWCAHGSESCGEEVGFVEKGVEREDIMVGRGINSKDNG